MNHISLRSILMNSVSKGAIIQSVVTYQQKRKANYVKFAKGETDTFR